MSTIILIIIIAAPYVGVLIDLIIKTRIEEKIKSGFAKINVTYQITQTEYIKLRFERVNELFSELNEQSNYIEHVSPFFINHYRIFDFTKEFENGRVLREKIKKTLMKTSFYIDKETRRLITDYISTGESLTASANNWGITKLVIENIEAGKTVLQSNGVPEDIDQLKTSLPRYLASFEEDRTKARQLFEEIELSLRRLLDVS